ncbi:MAG: family 43 glycosylhydrolase [Prevotella sp.]|nr:family 43 glycosylhydrolase [Prevotella sp.]
MKLLITILLSLVAVSSTKAGNTINNDTFWKTTSGSYIYSQGGGIFRFPDAQGVEHYYWYGAKYQEAVDYCPKALAGSKSNVTNFLAVTCYVSDDLVNWTFVRNVLTPEAAGWAYWVGRMGVAYIPEAKKYALLTQFNDHVLVATCSTPTGNYARHNEIDMTNMIGTPNTGDMTVFTDPDTGKSYLCYSYGKGRAKIYISEIGVLSNGKIGLKDCYQIFKGAGREGDCMFKYKNKYYVCASDLYGWNASNVYYLEASSIYGPYTPTNNMQIMPGSADDYGHVTQTGFFYTVRGSKQETVIYCGDRWAGFAGNGKGYNQWCPISFVDGKPYFNSLSQWHLDAETGEWWVGDDNNYVRNHFFNADRVKIPSSNKPSQADLKGWKTTVIKGNKVVIGGADSPVLNASNSSADREVVTGNYCLNIQDKVDFTRKVSQTVKSTPVVELKDGRYTLRCYVKSGSQFDELYMYAKVGNDTTRIDMPYSDSKWHEVIIENLQVSGGQVEVGFYADGKANAWCHIDEVSLVRKGDHGETNGISTIPTGQTTSQSNNRLYYNLSGTPSLQPYPGINIVRETINGTSKSYKIIRP